MTVFHLHSPFGQFVLVVLNLYMLFVRPLASSGNGHLCFGKNMHEWGWCEVASCNDQHDIALTSGVLLLLLLLLLLRSCRPCVSGRAPSVSTRHTWPRRWVCCTKCAMLQHVGCFLIARLLPPATAGGSTSPAEPRLLHVNSRACSSLCGGGQCCSSVVWWGRIAPPQFQGICRFKAATVQLSWPPIHS